MKQFLTAIILAIFAISCASTDEQSPDAESERAFANGKADSQWGVCQTEKLLQILNNTATTLGDLKSRGVHTRAANNIMATRNGTDALAGTEDDFVFEDLVQVDDVPWVGPSAMSELFSIVADLCVTADASQVDVIFSPQAYEDSHLAKVSNLIDEAQESIDIAMYSYSDTRIGAALERAVQRGVSIRMVFDTANAEKNKPAGSKSAKLEAAGIDVRYVNKIMHHKFAIIDGPRSLDKAGQGVLFTGSGNWSNSAGVRYDENTVFVYGNEELNLRYQAEFNHLWANSRDFISNTSLEFFESDSIDEFNVVDESGVDAVFTSPNFDTSYNSRYGNTFSTIAGTNTVANRLVEMIEQAQTSIWVASGHLRSRPVAEALLRKREQHPEMDIRIYLDGQEFIAETTHNMQLRTLSTCVTNAAGNVSKEQACYDRGFYFSYAIHEAGIPIKFKHYSFRWHYTYAVQMHHKYIIVDGTQVATGSYNLSDNAEHNTFENVVFFRAESYPIVVQDFVKNFETMWVLGEQEGFYQTLTDRIVNGTGDVPIVFDSMAITWEQVDALKRLIVKNCTDVNSAAHRSNPERHHYCKRRK